MGGEGADVYRAAQLSRGAPWALECVHRHFFVGIVFTDQCGLCRRVPRDSPRRGLGRALPRDIAGAIRREQRRTAVCGI